MKTKVFVSSTYIDLKSYREEIRKVLIKRDFIVKGMEGFGARTKKPLETCIEEVLESDIYIGIIGIRYGSVHKVTGKSFTQLEYEAAVKQKMEVLIYLLDEENSKITPAHIDYMNIERLRAFKKGLKENHTIDTFSNEDELAQKINEKINQISKQKVTIRPHKVDAKVFRFITDKEKFVAVVGYLQHKPFELWIGYEEDFFLPQWAKSGWIIKTYVKDEPIRYDFQFNDFSGYKIIFEGLSRSFDKQSYDFAKHVSNLFQAGLGKAELEKVISTIPYHNDDSIEFKKGIKQVIEQI